MNEILKKIARCSHTKSGRNDLPPIVDRAGIIRLGEILREVERKTEVKDYSSNSTAKNTSLYSNKSIYYKKM